MEHSELLILKSTYTMESSSASSDLASTSSANQPRRAFCGLRTHPPSGRASTAVDYVAAGEPWLRVRAISRSGTFDRPRHGELTNVRLLHCSVSPEHRLPTDASHCCFGSSHGCGEAHDF